MQGIGLAEELLASQEALSSMELITYLVSGTAVAQWLR